MRRIHVVAAVIERDGEILIARRPDHVHQGGKWEFPGGKVEAEEATLTALQRELAEELDIQVTAAQPLIKIAHDYPDKQVLLDVWRVTGFCGEPRGHEGQETRWVKSEALADYEFPAANVPIVTAARLPDHYVITPPDVLASSEQHSQQDFLAALQACMEQGYRLFQLRLKGMRFNATQGGLEQAAQVELNAATCDAIARLQRQFSARVLVNSDLPQTLWQRFDGVHLTSAALMALSSRPEGVTWLAASCHNLEQIRHAENIGVDFITLSPYASTGSHPGTTPIPHDQFAEWVLRATVPVYALGGVGPADVTELAKLGVQGAAGISAFWTD